jgi:hypothetical protein
MDGGHKSVSLGLMDYESVLPHHEPATIAKSWSYMDPPRSELATKINRMGKLIDDQLNVFHIETVLNNRMYIDQLDFLGRNEDDFTESDKLKAKAARWALDKMSHNARRKFFQAAPAPYDMIQCTAGATDPVHQKTLEKCFEQYCIRVKGQADILILGVPFITPYSVNSITNPILVHVMGPGYLFNLYRYMPMVKKGGVLILTHPLYDDFDPEFNPSYIEFFNRILPETRDPFVLREKYEEEFAKNPSYIQMYRQGNAYHGAHPFFMWYWGYNGTKHVDKIIVAGAENEHVPATLGWERAETMSDAVAMARSHLGRSAEITMLHCPPIVMADVE